MNSRGQTQLEKSGSENSANQRQSTFGKLISSLPARTNDNFMLLMLFVMGLSGFAYIFTTPLGKDKQRASLFDKIFNGEDKTSITSNFIKSNLLIIAGERVANAQMKFNFQGLSEGCDYELNFGDKCILPVINEQVTHTYHTPGTYKIELKKISRGNIYTVHCDYINIQ